MSFNITNYANVTSEYVIFTVSDPYDNIDYVNTSVTISPNQSQIVNFIYNTTQNSSEGVYSFFYDLYPAWTEGYWVPDEGDIAGRFGLNINTSQILSYYVNFTLLDPDKNIMKQEIHFCNCPSV